MFKWVVSLVILAFVLRVIFVFQGGVSFHYDMARDAFEARQIWKDHNLKILGPPTSTPGLYHGVLYYYLIAPFYMLGNGDPRVVAVFFSLLNSVVLIPLMLLAKDIFKNKRLAVFSGLLFVISFEATQYAVWLSNPAPAALTVALFFLFLHVWQKGKTYGLYLAVLSAALSTQFQFFLIYFFFLIPLFGIIFKIKTRPKVVGISFLVAILGLVNFFLAAAKFKTFANIFSGFLNIGTAGQIDFRVQFSELFLNYINRFTELFIFNFFPTNVFLGGILAILILYFIRKERLLLFFLFSNLFIFIFGGHTNTYANIGLVLPAILAVVYFLRKSWKFNKLLVYIIVFLIFISNIYAIFKYNPEGQLILVIPNDMNLRQELSLIDKTYELAQNQPFSINTLTLPLWTNTTWAYLYSWYGKNKYGFTPSFIGHNQVGLLGSESLKLEKKPLNKTFFIIEPHVGIPEDRFVLEIGSENSRSELIKEYLYGQLKLQFRKPINE